MVRDGKEHIAGWRGRIRIAAYRNVGLLWPHSITKDHCIEQQFHV